MMRYLSPMMPYPHPMMPYPHPMMPYTHPMMPYPHPMMPYPHPMMHYPPQQPIQPSHIPEQQSQQTNLVADKSMNVPANVIKQRVQVVRAPKASGCVPCNFSKCSKRTCGFVHPGQMCKHDRNVCGGEECDMFAKICSEKVNKPI
jgi:hypothetical protein